MATCCASAVCEPTLDAGVVLQGHVFTPGNYAYRQGMHLTDVIHSVDELQPNADLHYLLIRRELPPDRKVTVLSADMGAALNAPGSKADIELCRATRSWCSTWPPDAITSSSRCWMSCACSRTWTVPPRSCTSMAG